MKKRAIIQYFLLVSALFAISTGCARLKKWSDETFSDDSTSPNKITQNSSENYGSQVRQRLIENVPNLRFCLEKFLPPTRDNDHFEGVLTIKFAINRFGMVRNVLVTADSIRDIKTKGCLVKAATVIEMPNHSSLNDFIVNQPLGISMKKN